MVKPKKETVYKLCLVKIFRKSPNNEKLPETSLCCKNIQRVTRSSKVIRNRPGLVNIFKRRHSLAKKP